MRVDSGHGTYKRVLAVRQGKVGAIGTFAGLLAHTHDRDGGIAGCLDRGGDARSITLGVIDGDAAAGAAGDSRQRGDVVWQVYTRGTGAH